MPRGITAREIGELVDEHGSIEAAIEARPDLADQLRGVQRLSAALGEQARAVQRAMPAGITRALTRAPERRLLRIADPIETQAAAFELALRRAREEPRGESGRPRQTITQDELHGLFKRGLERARSTKKRRQPSYDSIADEYGLKRTWTTPIVKWAETHQRAAREAIVTSKTPRRFSALVRDNRL
jgi:hypothetical protein